MAARKKSTKKQKQSVKFNVQWLILILVSFLMIAFVYFKQGKIGNEISLVLGGIFGFIKYFLPVAMLIFTIFMIAENEKKVTSKVFVFFLFFLIFNFRIIYKTTKKTRKIFLVFNINLFKFYFLQVKVDSYIYFIFFYHKDFLLLNQLFQKQIVRFSFKRKEQSELHLYLSFLVL